MDSAKRVRKSKESQGKVRHCRAVTQGCPQAARQPSEGSGQDWPGRPKSEGNKNEFARTPSSCHLCMHILGLMVPYISVGIIQYKFSRTLP